MANIWHDIHPSRISHNEFISVIEISKGGKNKYELDKDTGMLMLDRVLYTSTHYPANYGFIPRTYGDDKDPLDVLVLCQEAILPLTLVNCRPIGMINMVDDEYADEKIIAIPLGDPSMVDYQDISQLPPHTIQEISHFFEVYKGLEGKNMVVKDMYGADVAQQTIKKAMMNYVQKYLIGDHSIHVVDREVEE
ncbi:MAG: inorganic diphosphatase [Clostridiales bacterium]|nr:inorganic diphosphatase [Clostridiales bacterium]